MIFLEYKYWLSRKIRESLVVAEFKKIGYKPSNNYFWRLSSYIWDLKKRSNFPWNSTQNCFYSNGERLKRLHGAHNNRSRSRIGESSEYFQREHLRNPDGALFFTFPVCKCFFCLALEFWNHTWVTLLLSPVICAILSRSCPSGFESSWKFACNTCSCSSVNVVRTRFALFLLW